MKKWYKINILNNIDLRINNGEVLALLGHNCSGKSTLIKCICGVLKPTDGKIEIDGLDTFKKRKKIINNMGVLFNQKSSFITDIDVYSNLLFFKTIYEISDRDFNKRVDLIDSYLK